MYTYMNAECENIYHLIYNLTYNIKLYKADLMLQY